MELFGEDCFSKGEPSFSECDKKTTEDVSKLLKLFFSSQLGMVEYIGQVGAFEINSSNFLIRTTKQKYILKKMDLQAICLNKLKDQFKVAVDLWTNGVLLPKIIKNDKDQLITVFIDKAWVLTEFINGNYYSGTLRQLTSAAREMGIMYTNLNKLKSTFFNGMRREDPYKNIQEISSKYLNDFSSAKCKLSNNNSILIEENLSFVANALRSFEQKYRKLDKANLQVCHIDIHPHNLLYIKDSVSAIVDIESLQYSYIETSIGFAAYKLIRQYAVFHKCKVDDPRINHATQSFLYSFLETYRLNVNHDDLKCYAAFEILRRIFIILELNFNQNDTAWDAVLPIQLKALKEIPYVFSETNCHIVKP